MGGIIANDGRWGPLDILIYRNRLLLETEQRKPDWYYPENVIY